MSDINLINNPGVQGPNNIDDSEDNILEDNNHDTENLNIGINKKTNKSKVSFLAFVAFAILSIPIIYFYNSSNIIESNINKDQSFLLEDIISILDDNQANININLIVFEKKQFFIDFQCADEESFYKLFNSFSNIIKYNIKGYHIQNNYVLNIKLPWKIENNRNFNIDLLNKELTDLGLDLKQEIFKNKLIMVSDIDKIFKFINLITELNLIDKFSIEIKQELNIPNNIIYRVIVE